VADDRIGHSAKRIPAFMAADVSGHYELAEDM
jgi:hypothetical protein